MLQFNHLKKGFLFLFLFVQSVVYSQVINGYAKVTNVSGAVLTVSNVNEAADSFEDDEWVVIMQMQDNVIGTTTNTAGFGSLGSILSAGLFEIRQIDSHTESGGSPATITLKNPPTNTYNTGSNSSVQIITYRELGSPNFTTTSNISALDWDGNVGGVVAMHIEGTLTLQHSIDADAAGFRGGSRSANFNGPICTAANTTVYRVNNNRYGFKGEGIFKRTAGNQQNGRGHILNGAGGGSHHNGGGGGGGNFSDGGQGGNGWNNCTTNPAGGLGGLSLAAEITGSRVFMGGGGGGGQQNNGRSRDGGNGGGIVLIHANEIVTSCGGSLSISANGIGPLTSGTNDGGGGGGAGGSLVFWVETWSVDPGCPLTISSNGGDGSSSLSGGSHAGGGGGGQGVAIFNSTPPTSNVTVETLNGDPGCGNTSVPCNSLAGSAGGLPSEGVLSFPMEPLPVELTAFEATVVNKSARLDWVTASERNNDKFIIERTADGINWEEVAIVKGAGNSTVELTYQTWDFSPLSGLSYYRLTQVDFDGSSEQSEALSIYFNNEVTLLYPNPAKNQVTISKSNIDDYTIQVVDALGRIVDILPSTTQNGQVAYDISTLPAGLYFIQLSDDNETESHRFVKTN